jgi:uncharacterized protein YkwD
MKRRLLLWILALSCTPLAQAWQPVGWVYAVSPAGGALYTYSHVRQQWQYHPPGGRTWACTLATGRWAPLSQSSLRAGWSYWIWPYAYSAGDRTWQYIAPGADHWVAHLSSGEWSRFGQSAVPSLIAQYEARVHTLVNEHRAAQALPPLTHDANIADIARTHSRNMAEGLVPFDHDGFQTGPDSRVDQISAFMSISEWSENLQWSEGYSDPAEVCFTGWRDSPGHNENLLDPNFNRAGVGVARSTSGRWYFTQIYVRHP